MNNKNITKRLSKSKLNTFKDCPKQYWFSQYFPHEAVPAPAMIRGSELHDIFEEFYKNYNGGQYKDFKSVINNLNRIPNAEKYPEQMKMFGTWLSELNFQAPESCEEKIYSKSQDMVIKWDRIDYDKTNRVIWDYKTGQLYEGSQFINKFKFELMLYAFIFMLETKKRVDYVGIYFVDHGVQKLIKVNDEKIQEVIGQIFELKLEMNDYQNSNIWPERYSYKCRWCQWKDNCDSYKRFKK